MERVALRPTPGKKIVSIKPKYSSTFIFTFKKRPENFF